MWVLLNEVSRTYIKLDALLGNEIILDDNLPNIKMPRIKDIAGVLTYVYLFSTYIELYDEKKSSMFSDISDSSKARLEFAMFLKYFTNIETLEYRDCKFMYSDDVYISVENISVFMQVIKIIHNRDKKQDYYTYTNSLVDKHLQRVQEAKKRIAEQKKMGSKSTNKSNDDNGYTGLHEIISTVSARHPSLSLLKLNELNYYQLLDQYNRLLKIDEHVPVLHGNATEEYVKNLKHYSSEIINED